MHPPPETMSSSRLLGLPAEIRSMIFQYSVTHDGTLVSTPERSLALWSPKHGYFMQSTEPLYFNSLQYVCRATNGETKNLLLRCNECLFKGEHQAIHKMCGLKRKKDLTAVSGLDHFFGFIYGHNPPGPKGLHKAIIQYEGPMFPVDYQTLFSLLADDSLLSTFCQQHPQVQIVIRFRMFFNTRFPGRFLELANILSLFRNTLLCERLPVRFRTSVNVQVARLSRHAAKIHLPPNLRVSIVHNSGFNAGDLQHPLVTEQNWLPGTSPAQIKEMADVVEKVFHEGL